MKKWKRSLFFWILVLAFFVTAPAVILRARGYRFDFGRGVFVYSGSITIKSNPQNINVIIDGKINESKLDRINSASQISGLMPGEYDLQVTTDDFQTWKKRVQIKSGLSTEFWNVLLVRKNYEKTTYPMEKVERFFISPKNELMASSVNEELGLKLDILNINDRIVENTFSFPEFFLVPQEAKENIEWSPEKSLHLSIPVIKKNDSREYLILDLDSKKYFPLKEFLNINSITNVRWHPQKENYLFFISDDNLYKANITDEEDLALIANDISAFNLSGSYIYFSQKSNEITYRRSLDKLEEMEQITNSFPENQKHSIKKIIIYDKERIAYLDKEDNLFIYNHGERGTYFKELGSNIEGLHFSDDGKKLLFWTSNEISVYFLRAWEVQPIRQEDALVNITRYMETIDNVQWFTDYEHILFNTGSYLKIIELDSRDQRNSMDVLTFNKTASIFTFDAFLEKLFLIDSGNKIYSIEFPEKETFLGF